MKSFYLKKLFRKNCKSAFSLIELSIVILIVSILIAGGLKVSISKINSVKIEAAQKRIDTIYKALGIYLATNKALPCPASILETKTSSSTYGQAVGTAGNCSGVGTYIPSGTNRVYGMVPVSTLKLGMDMAEDGFGSKFAYVVDKRFTIDGSSGFGANTNNSGLMTVKEITSAGTEQVNTTEAIFLIISYGANKFGAFNADSSTQNSRSSDSYEMSNDLDSMSTPAFDNTFIKSSKLGDVFDDIIFYKTRNALVSDFNALDLIFCKSGDTNYNDVVYATTMQWTTTTEYGKVVSGTACPSGYTASVDRPTKKCGAYGVWEAGTINPCLENGTGAGGNGTGGGSSSSTLSCTGGTVIGARILKFTSSGSLVCTGSGTINYLIVGGGGGGGGDDTDYGGGGGGGGGGGVKTGTYSISSNTTIAVTVGAGGTGGTSAASPTNGGNGSTSSLGAIASATGGVGGTAGGNNLGIGGNSGAGDSTAKTGGASGTCPGSGTVHGAGGGGASMVSNGTAGNQLGTDPSHGGGAGAGGKSSSITGFSVVYGGGGGGGAGGVNSEGYSSPVQGGGAGGAGGGGIGNRNAVNDPSVGTNYLGGGGGGGGKGNNGAAGGKGVVIISY